MGYIKRVISGLSWMAGLKIITRVLAFVRLALLARLLSPLEFGLFGIATLALALLETLTETGINVFFIQKEGELREYLNSAWTVSVIRGFFISIAIFVFAHPISVFFHSVGAYPLLVLMSVVPILRGFINPAIVKYQKDLEFKNEFYFRTTVFLVEVIVSIVSVLILKSALGMVLGMIASVLTELVMSFIFLEFKPQLKVEIEKIEKVLRRGRWITLSGIFQYVFSNGDNIVIGKLMEANALGLYQNAYKISTVPITEITEVFNKVTFPIFSQISSDKKRLRKAFLKSVIFVLLLVIPVGLVIYIFTEPIVLILLGNKWLGAVDVLKILSVFGVVRALEGITTPLFLAVKKQEYVTQLTFLSVLGLAVTIFPLVSMYGIIGAGYSVVIGTLLNFPLTLYNVYKIIK